MSRATDAHIESRANLLEREVELASPPVPVPRARAEDVPGPALDDFLGRLGETGLAACLLDRPLADEHFRALGHVLGTPLPESDPAVLPRVSLDVVLNLVGEGSRTDDVSLQPFAANSLSLHTEGSGRPLTEQPRYIVLMCCEPGDATGAAQTVLAPMDVVASRLTSSESAILSRTRYRRSAEGPPILRGVDGRRVFSFRDFVSEPLEWTHTGTDASHDSVDRALRALLTSMYTPGVHTGVRWERGLLLAIDNTFYFHGRRAGTFAPRARRRHLKRLRIR
ncbi:TauD/TfdA family dioxygenase [Streptomyces sp. 110]|uniref:TauD/TfdA family dioxygenase n=1 Tax=Streptomyces endocoffeicus TaxID=2898945 RepID=A0ABS1PSU7_9ACTN|nr:TauD/TfdA family dioxygenase [Streptomyces endocoffeicus]MBL1114982.1 TauD/TfdA family dioxygenase [Streptomyces endocoffeicus]